MTRRANPGAVRSDETLLTVVHGLKQLDGAGVTELAEHVGRSKSTVHRHLTSLSEHQYVVQEGETYHLGLRFLDLGGYVRNRRSVYKRIRSKVRELAVETEEAVQFVAEEHGRGVFIYRERGAKAANTASRIGSRIYLHRAAAGKAILAHLPEPRVDEILDRWGLPAETENTITDRAVLERELAEIRESDIAADRGEHISQLRAVGTAVLDPEGDVLGGISISGPAHRMDGEPFETALRHQLLGAVNELELNIAYA